MAARVVTKASKRSGRFSSALSLTALSFALGLGLATRTAAAQPGAGISEGDLKKAREQFGQALALQTAGDWTGALALLKEVAAVKSTPQVRFNIALCEEKLGKLVAALGDYQLAAADARAEKAEQVAEEVEARLESLEQRIPKLTVTRGAGAEAASVVLDGVSVGDRVIGSPMPTDPGPHIVEATAPGMKAFRRSVRVGEQQSEVVELTLEPEAAPVSVTKPPVAPRPAPIHGYVVGGIGLASLAASGVFFGLRASEISHLNQICPAHRCPPSAQSDIDAGKLDTTIANVTLAVGLAAVAGGLVLVLTSRPSQASVALAPGAAGAQLLGNF